MCVCVDFRIHSFEYACDLCILCFFPFFPLQNKVQQVRKESKTKKVCEKVTMSIIYFYFLLLTGITELAKCFKEEQFTPVLSKMSQCA